MDPEDVAVRIAELEKRLSRVEVGFEMDPEDAAVRIAELEKRMRLVEVVGSVYAFCIIIVGGHYLATKLF